METLSRGPVDVLHLAMIRKGEKELEHILLAENPEGPRCVDVWKTT